MLCKEKIKLSLFSTYNLFYNAVCSLIFIDIKQEGHEALNRSPEYIGQSQTFNFEI